MTMNGSVFEVKFKALTRRRRRDLLLFTGRPGPDPSLPEGVNEKVKARPAREEVSSHRGVAVDTMKREKG